MNLLPLINRPSNVQFFSNPLHGLTYGKSYQNNNKVCINAKSKELSTISYHSSSLKNQKFSTINQQKIKSTHRLKQSSLNQSYQFKEKNPINISKLKKYNLEMTLDNSNYNNETLLLSSRSSKMSKKQSRYIFPQVSIIYLNQNDNYEDMQNYTVNISLQSYFKLYFPNQFKHDSKRLNEHLSKYMPLLKKYNILNRQLNKSQWPQNFWGINNINSFMEISQSYDKTSQYWVKYILILIYIYFVPHKTVRKNCLQNFSQLIIKKMSEKSHKQLQNQDIILLNQHSDIIEDFIDISFSTKKLFIIKKQNQQKISQILSRYNQSLQTYRSNNKNKGFVNRLRNHFRKQTVPDKFTQQTINYQRDQSSKDKERKKYLDKANYLLQQKKQKALKFHKIIDLQNSRLRSRSQMQRQQFKKQQELYNNSKIIVQKQVDPYKFHIQLNDKKRQSQILNKFKAYNHQNKKKNPGMKQNEIYIGSLLQNQYVLQQMIRSSFHSRKLKIIFEILLNTTMIDNWQYRSTINWNQFVQFSILTSKDIQKLMINPDCYQLVRKFVQQFMEIKQDDYFRDQLTSKIYSLVQVDQQNIHLVEEVLWNWLSQNNFIKMGSIQRQLLWKYQQRSKNFYLLILCLLFGTFRTTLMDLAYQLLV